MIHSAKDLFKIEKEYNHLSWKQKVLAKQVEIPKKREGYFPNTGDIVLAMDIQYQKDKAYVAGDLHYWKKEHIGTFVGVAQAEMPYVPTYFCFREGPPLLLLIEELQKRSFFPDMIVVDGHGLAHPRFFGVACWLGVFTDKPIVGCAKKTLLPYHGKLGTKRGSKLQVIYDNRTVGYVLRTQDNVKPIFVSPGHRISLQNSVKIVLMLPGNYRVPDPLRHADHAARNHCKGKAGEWYDLGILD